MNKKNSSEGGVKGGLEIAYKNQKNGINTTVSLKRSQSAHLMLQLYSLPSFDLKDLSCQSQRHLGMIQCPGLSGRLDGRLRRRPHARGLVMVVGKQDRTCELDVSHLADRQTASAS
ncbi:hypothetical protein TSMEX_009136 [Taenia solium]|eukprot:TsM_001057800 transcript=TsM_001057800 gene=TsM_001057800